VSQRNPSLKFSREEPSDLYRLIKRGLSFSGRERNCCFLNLRQTRFADVSAVSGIDFDDDGRSVSFVDWDFDGDLDAWLVNRSGPQVRLVRNELPPGQDFLAVKLHGVRCNRDAVGARVTVRLRGDRHAPLMRTVRAGEGFLTQSSRWLHFGLGASAEIEQVAVRWPSGETEEIAGLAANGHYEITQGDGQGRRFAPPESLARLKAEPLPAEKLEAPPRALLGGMVPVPALKYQAWDGQAVALDVRRGRPLLLVFWASWCEPCVEELKQLDAAQESLAAAGIDVLALSADIISAEAELAAQSRDDPSLAKREVLEERQRAARKAAQEMLDRLHCTLPSGLAHARTVDVLQIVLDESLARVAPIGVPQSFLLDDQHRLFGVYRGPVSVQAVLEDARLLSLDDAERRSRSVPFAGRWLAVPNKDVIMEVAAALLDQGYVEEGVPYVEAHGSRLAKNVDYAVLLATAAGRCFDQARFDEAAAWCRKAIGVNAGLQPAYNVLGLAEYQLGHPKEATKALKRSLDLKPNHLGSLRTLAWVLATTKDDTVRNGPEAVRLAERAMNSIGPDPDPNMFDILAVAYAAAGEFEKAVRVANEGLQRAKRDNNEELILMFQRRLAIFQRRIALEAEPPKPNQPVPQENL
jgi:tetratricopeptide (TPR) repeat protein